MNRFVVSRFTERRQFFIGDVFGQHFSALAQQSHYFQIERGVVTSTTNGSGKINFHYSIREMLSLEFKL